MAKKEVKTDLWVASQLDKCKIQFTAQGSDVKEIDEVLSTASKRGTGNAGYPEYVAVVNDFVIVIEDKADLDKHIKLTDTALIETTTKAITDYAVNGAYFYAKHIAQNSSFKKVFAIGVSGDAKHHKITPLYVDDREGYIELEDVENNSKLGYGTNEPLDKKIFSKGHLCVVNNGSAIGYTYYQPGNFTCTHDVNPLWLRSCKMNKYLGLFLSQMIKSQGICFAYARKWRPSRMIHSCIMLPVNDNDEPDYEFMEECGRKIMAKKYIQYLKYLESTCESSDLLLK